MSKLISGLLQTYQNSLSIPRDAPSPHYLREYPPQPPGARDRGKTVDARNTYFLLYVPHYYIRCIVQALITPGQVCAGVGWLRAHRILWGKLNSAMTKSHGFALAGNLLDLFVLEMICGNSSRLFLLFYRLYIIRVNLQGTVAYSRSQLNLNFVAKLNLHLHSKYQL